MYLGKPIASGGYGTVYKGEYFGKDVAIKSVRRSVAIEFALIANIKHENIVRYYAWEMDIHYR